MDRPPLCTRKIESRNYRLINQNKLKNDISSSCYKIIHSTDKPKDYQGKQSESTESLNLPLIKTLLKNVNVDLANVLI